MFFNPDFLGGLKRIGCSLPSHIAIGTSVFQVPPDRCHVSGRKGVVLTEDGRLLVASRCRDRVLVARGLATSHVVDHLGPRPMAIKTTPNLFGARALAVEDTEVRRYRRVAQKLSLDCPDAFNLHTCFAQTDTSIQREGH